jgi:hypothetical protein
MIIAAIAADILSVRLYGCYASDELGKTGLAG